MGEGRVGKRGSQVLYCRGQAESGGVGRDTHSPATSRKSEECYFSGGGGGREEGLALAALQHSMAQEESC